MLSLSLNGIIIITLCWLTRNHHPIYKATRSVVKRNFTFFSQGKKGTKNRNLHGLWWTGSGGIRDTRIPVFPLPWRPPKEIVFVCHRPTNFSEGKDNRMFSRMLRRMLDERILYRTGLSGCCCSADSKLMKTWILATFSKPYLALFYFFVICGFRSAEKKEKKLNSNFGERELDRRKSGDCRMG